MYLPNMLIVWIIFIPNFSNNLLFAKEALNQTFHLLKLACEILFLMNFYDVIVCDTYLNGWQGSRLKPEYCSCTANFLFVFCYLDLCYNLFNLKLYLSMK